MTHEKTPNGIRKQCQSWSSGGVSWSYGLPDDSMTIDPAINFRTLKALDTFTDRSLNLKPKGKFLSGFYYERTTQSICCKHLRRNRWESGRLTSFSNKNVPISNIYREYLKTVEILGIRFGLNEKYVMLAFDYTDEDFYGNFEKIISILVSS